MSKTKQPQITGHTEKEISISTGKSFRKPKFSLPGGYRLGWKGSMVRQDTSVSGYVLRDTEGTELGFFEFAPYKTVEDILKDHLKIQIVQNGRNNAKAIIILEDSNGRRVGQWELYQHTRSRIETVVRYLANR